MWRQQNAERSELRWEEHNTTLGIDNPILLVGLIEQITPNQKVYIK